ncbi:MAG: YceD family protein [Caulobacterales bacterium]|jgi:uncharacterized metal-binding protein YceD (DUF177 family)
MSRAWTTPVRLHELGRGTLNLRLEPDEAERARIAKDLGLESLPALAADLTLKPWMDGVEITGRFDAVVEQICAVSLDNFEQPLSGEIEVRAVPSGSPQAPAAAGGEVDYDPQAPDPPDVLADEAIDLAAYVIEHLALEIDPFARKPGVEFDYTPPEGPESPFAVLRKLKDGET